MFKWTIEQAILTHASNENIWNIWKNIQDWPKWDTDLEWSKLEGNFTLNAIGSLKPKGMGIYRFKITELADRKSFTTNTPMFMTSMRFEHAIAELNKYNKITHKVIVSGLLAPLLYFVMRKNLQNQLELSLQKLSKMAEDRGTNG